VIFLLLKLKVCYFDTIEMTEEDLQVVLNTLREHDFQDASENWQKRWKLCIHTERDYFEGDVASRLKVSF
jgi:hypothetical protein